MAKAPDPTQPGVQLTSNGIEIADGTSIRATLGILIPTSPGVTQTYGLRVISAGGTTVIIDGTSDMFKIAATGTVSGAWPGATNSSVNYTAGLPGLGTYTGVLPAAIFMLALSTVTTFSRFSASFISIDLPTGTVNYDMKSWVQFTSTDPGPITVVLSLECATLAVSAAVTGTMRYYVLQEVGI